MSTSFGWEVDRHSVQCTSPVRMVSQCNLMSGCDGYENEDKHNPVGFENTIYFLSMHISIHQCECVAGM